MLIDELFVMLLVFLISRDVVSSFEEGEHLKAI